MSKKLTNEIVDSKLIGRNILRVGEYMGAHTKIQFMCLIDGRKFYGKKLKEYMTNTINGLF